jgi:hypothetical protein
MVMQESLFIRQYLLSLYTKDILWKLLITMGEDDKR